MGFFDTECVTILSMIVYYRLLLTKDKLKECYRGSMLKIEDMCQSFIVVEVAFGVDVVFANIIVTVIIVTVL